MAMILSSQFTDYIQWQKRSVSEIYRSFLLFLLPQEVLTCVDRGNSHKHDEDGRQVNFPKLTAHLCLRGDCGVTGGLLMHTGLLILIVENIYLEMYFEKMNSRSVKKLMTCFFCRRFLGKKGNNLSSIFLSVRCLQKKGFVKECYLSKTLANWTLAELNFESVTKTH